MRYVRAGSAELIGRVLTVTFIQVPLEHTQHVHESVPVLETLSSVSFVAHTGKSYANRILYEMLKFE